MWKKTLAFVVCIAIAFAPALIGNLATIPNIDSWYRGLEKPPLVPEDGVFGPVWTIIYFFTGISLFLVYRSGVTDKRRAYGLFAAHAVLNAGWSVVFFGLHQPWIALAIILMLLVVIVWCNREFRRHSAVASWLFIPYIAWVAFATYLNAGVAWLN